MNLSKVVVDDIHYVGASDRRLALFENIYPIDRGVSYNSYLVMDEKVVLLDTVDHSVASQFYENVYATLSGRTIDYLIVNHVEPDHAAMIGDILEKFPAMKVVGNQLIIRFLTQFFGSKIEERAYVVKEGDVLETGKHKFTFVMAPMVHWPEVMMTYDMTDKVLFSADAFGTFGALSGSIFADDYEFDKEWLDDARRYYTNIVGKYGLKVQEVLKKAGGIELKMILPLHGPIWRKDLGYFIGKYLTWASYGVEEEGILIAYASIYGNTENVASYLALALGERGVKNIHMYDVSKTDPSYILSDCFKYGKALFLSPTYNLGLFPKMETLLLELKAHLWQKRKVALVESGTWSIQSGKLMKEILSSLPEIEFIGEKPFTIKSHAGDDMKSGLDQIADELVK